MAQEYYDDSYSKYPTDDKKYEYRTGPFEGFFVGSVELCKHVKFNDDKDNKDTIINNRTGTQGPPGPQGIQGIKVLLNYSYLLPFFGLKPFSINTL
jgi:hypothetical protein